MTPIIIVLILSLYVCCTSVVGQAVPSELPTSQPSNLGLNPTYANYTVDIITAANSLSKAAVEKVLKAGDIPSMNLKNLTFVAVSAAIYKISLEIVSLLLDKTECAVDQKSGADGNTYLMMAAMRGNNDIVKLLLTSKADPKILNWRGEDALTFAKKTGQTEVVRTLQEAMMTDTGKMAHWFTPSKPWDSYTM
jgi:ankyrin repeat protein